MPAWKKFLKDNQFKVAAYVDGMPEITGQGVRDITAATDTDKKYLYVWQANALIVLSYLDYRNQPPVSLFPQKDKAAYCQPLSG